MRARDISGRCTRSHICIAACLMLAAVGGASETPQGSQPGFVSAPGRIEPDHGVVRVGAPIDLGASVVRRQLVSLGGWVREGDPIAELDTHDVARANVEVAERHLASTKARLEEARSGAAAAAIAVSDTLVKVAIAEQELAARNLERVTALRGRGAIADSQYEETQLSAARAVLAVDRARRERDQAQAALNQGILIAQAERAEAEASVAHARAQLDRTVIRAPRDGKILQLIAKPGEQIGIAGLCLIGDTRKLFAVADVYQADIAQVRVGQKASITDRSSAHRLPGRVTDIGLLAGKQEMEGLDPANPRGSRVVQVRIQIDADLAQMPIVGSEVVANIDVDRSPGINRQ